MSKVEEVMEQAGITIEKGDVVAFDFGYDKYLIAEVCARACYDTLVREVNEEFVAKGLERIDQSMQKAAQRGKLSPADLDTARSRVRGTTRLEDFADRDLVIEAAIEDVQIKKDMFAQLDPYHSHGDRHPLDARLLYMLYNSISVFHSGHAPSVFILCFRNADNE